MSSETPEGWLPTGAVERLGEPRIHHPAAIVRILALGDGERVVTAGAWRPELRVWSLPERRLLLEITLPTQGPVAVVDLDASPAGDRLACVLRGGEGFLLDATTGEMIRPLARSRRKQEAIRGISFAPDGERLVHVSTLGGTSPGSGVVRWSRADSGELLESLPIPGGFQRARLAPDHRRLAVFTPGLRLHRLPSGERIPLEPPPDPSHLYREALPLCGGERVLVDHALGASGPGTLVLPGLTAAAQSRDGSRVVAVAGRTMVLVDPDTGGTREIGPAFDRLALHPDGSRVLAADHHEGLTELEVEPDEVPGKTANPRVLALAFTPGGALLAAANPLRGLGWKPDGDGVPPGLAGVPAPPIPEGVEWLLTTLDYWGEQDSPPLRLEIMDEAGTVRAWFRDCSPRAWTLGGELVDSGVHRSLRFPDIPLLSPDGRWLASMRGRSEDLMPSVGFGRLATLVRRGEIDRPGDYEGPTRWRRPDLDPEARVRNAFRGRLLVFRADDGTPVADTFPFEGRRLTALAFSPDSQQLACGARSGELALLELPEPEGRVDLTRAGGTVRALAFSPDRRLLVAACRRGRRDRRGNQLQVFDLRTRRPLGVVGSTGAREEVKRLLFAPRGDVLAAVVGHESRGRSWWVLLLELERRESSGGAPGVGVVAQARLADHHGRILDLAFSRDGARLATSGEEGCALVYDVGALLRSGACR